MLILLVSSIRYQGGEQHERMLPSLHRLSFQSGTRAPPIAAQLVSPHLAHFSKPNKSQYTQLVLYRTSMSSENNKLVGGWQTYLTWEIFWKCHARAVAGLGPPFNFLAAPLFPPGNSFIIYFTPPPLPQLHTKCPSSTFQTNSSC